jgi:hypothetical protein
MQNNFDVEIDRVEPDTWGEILEGFQDSNLCQTWAYGAIRWGKGNLSHLVLRRSGEVIAAAQLRLIRRRPFPGGIAYMRWGPLVHRCGTVLNQDIFSRMASALYKEYVIDRRLCLRVLPDAFIGSERAVMMGNAFAGSFKAIHGVLRVERTFLLDLTPPLDQLRRRLDQKWRNQLNRAEKNNLEIRIGKDNADFELFDRLYREMLNRKRFETAVNIDEFKRFYEALRARSELILFLCYSGDDVVSGIVCSALGEKGIYILGATSDSGLQSKGAYLLQWSMIRWLKENGFRYYDLGGIEPELNPGVYHFKKGLSGQDVTRLPAFQSCEYLYSGLYMKLADLVVQSHKKPPLQRFRDTLNGLKLLGQRAGV